MRNYLQLMAVGRGQAIFLGVWPLAGSSGQAHTHAYVGNTNFAWWVIRTNEGMTLEEIR